MPLLSISEDEVAAASRYYGVGTSSLGPIMELTKTHLGWTEMTAVIATSQEMWRGLYDAMPEDKKLPASQ